jgi:hypothetical protein
MDMIGYMAEIVLVAFILGGFLGAAIAVHVSRPRSQEMHHGEAVAVKVKARR